MKFILLPGSADTPIANGAAKPAPAISAKPGTVQSRALENPLVQHAQKLFDAEIRSIIDLSKKN